MFLGVSPARAMDRFSAPTGPLGANLTFDEDQRFRAHMEMAYTTRTTTGTLHALGWTFGAGIKLADRIEVEVALPVGGLVATANGTTADQFGVGNLSLGANLFTQLGDSLRLKVGGLIAFGPWSQSNDLPTAEGLAAYLAGVSLSGYQDLWLHLPGFVHLVVPARIELGEEVQLTGDGSIHVAIPTMGTDSDLFVTLAPGVAFWVVPQFALGARLMLQLLTANDAAQVSLEPFVRLNLGERGFLASRFTMHFDEDLGFSFDTGRTWGLHLAAGGSF